MKTITIKEDVRIPGSDIILEKGDKIEIKEANIEPKMTIEIRKYIKSRNIDGIVDIMHMLQKAVSDIAKERSFTHDSSVWKSIVGELDGPIVDVEKIVRSYSRDF